MESLKFIAPSSFIGPKFWEELYKRKMNEYKLDDSEKEIKSFYSLQEGIVRFEPSSFSANDSIDFSLCHSTRLGTLFNFNTINVCYYLYTFTTFL